MRIHDPMFLLPDASSMSPRIDLLFWTMVGMCTLVAVGVMTAMVYFCVRYGLGSHADRSNRHKKNLTVELSWTLIPLVIFLGMFTWSLFLFAQLHTPPANSQTIYVVAKQWMWKIQHPGGQREINMLHVPLGQPIRLTMTSQDVIHSFYVPAFRVKQDVLPGRYTRLWFTPTELGRFPLECSEYCGLDHSKMRGYVVVMRPSDYARWLHEHVASASVVAQGREIFRQRGCSGCHSAQASVHAPDLHGIYGRVVHLSNGKTVVADERYIHDSIMQPDSQVVAGYAPIMPSFKGQIPASDMLKLMAYLKSNTTDEQPAPTGQTEKRDEHD
ncbi:MAG TPA: cytochrome c oxidase subunit II [Rhodanobacteraceae bacterium]|nr:cytochrome c oxidase subunit II [Rhodanobacteraceae bacterium]